MSHRSSRIRLFLLTQDKSLDVMLKLGACVRLRRNMFRTHFYHRDHGKTASYVVIWRLFESMSASVMIL
jgi:hypothetical protein